MAASSNNRVREARIALGLSQVALAQAAALSRQSIGAIEASRATPAVDVALRLARALETSVEDLFGTPTPAEPLLTEPTSSPLGGRVAVAQIAGRWLSYQLDRDALRTSADGLVEAGPSPREPVAEHSRSKRPRRAAQRAPVQPLRTLDELRGNLVLMGCALGLGLLAERLNSRAGAGRFLWFARSSTDALAALARQHTHLAGVHLVDAKTGEANVSDVRRHVGREAVTLIALGRWEAGLVTAPNNPKAIRSAADLGRAGLRCVVREPGSGARRLLERELARAGLPRALVNAAPLQASGHLQVASAVAMGAADTGVATRDAALAFGLHFVPLAEERYDLVVPRDASGDPRLSRLFDTLSSSAFQRELACLGYDVRCSGDRVAELSAA